MKTIVWDVDDVLNDLMQEWFNAWRPEHPTCSITYNDLTRNPPDSLLEIGLDEYLRSLDLFRQSWAYRDMAPVREIREWFGRNGSRYHHSVLTAVPVCAASASAQWVFAHFGEWVRTFHFVPSKRGNEAIPEYDRNKAKFLKRRGDVDLFVDDNSENVGAAREVGINALLFPRPWNNGDMTVPELLARVANL